MPPFQNQTIADVLQSRCSQYLQENTCAGVSFLKKFQSFRPATLKETPAKVLSCEYCKIFKNSFFIEHFRWLLLPFTSTFWNYYWKDRWITVNKDHVHSTPKKHSKKVLGMLQVVNKETQSLLLTFSMFHVLF